jgi:signal transduction histidine kinase
MELHTQINGQLIYLLAQASPLYTTEGNISSAILVYQDITRMKQLEHTREDFFTTMAHELKTPLANIRAHLSALLTQDLHWSNEEQQDFLQTADQQVDRLVGMINHFLDASRVEAGALRLELEPIIIPELFEDLQDRLEALINTSRCRLAIFMPEQLPAIQGDYELIMSVLTNLLSNAFRYAPENDAVHLCADPIFDRSKQRLSGIKFSVIDHGPGISKEQQGALFTRFSTFAELTQSAINDPAQPELTRHQKNTRWSPGTGLGLYISRGILEAHGSQLQLISSPGNGAQFTFTLPVYKKQGKRHRASSLAGVFRVE